MAQQDNAFLGTRQILLVGLGGVGGKIVDQIMRDLPEERKNYTQAIAIDTDLGEMNKLEFIPRENKIALANSPQSGKAMTIGEYLQKNPDAEEWLITKGKALDTLLARSTKQGAKQIRMISRLALSATAKYYNLEHRIDQIVSNLTRSDGSANRDGLIVMVICSVAGGTGAGTVLQMPMFLEDIITRHYDRSAIDMQCAMLLPNLFSSTQATGNLEKGRANGYAVMRELQSLNTGKLKRFEYLKNTAEIDPSDPRKKAPYSFVLLFDNATSSGATINGATDTKHIPNIASCIAEYLYGPASQKCTSQLDNTLDKVYSSGGTAIFRAVGKAELVYPDNLYRQYAAAKWIQTSVSDEWLGIDEEVKKVYKEEAKLLRDQGKPRPSEQRKHQLYVKALDDNARFTGQFFTEIRQQLSGIDPTAGAERGAAPAQSIGGRRTTRAANQSTATPNGGLADVFLDGVLAAMMEKMDRKGSAFATTFSNLKQAILNSLSERKKTIYEENLNNLYNVFCEFMRENAVSFVDNVMRPSESLKPSFLSKNDQTKQNTIQLYPFIVKHRLHPIALRCFLYQLEQRLEERQNKEEFSRPEDREKQINYIRTARRQVDAIAQTEQFAITMKKTYAEMMVGDICKRMLKYVQEMIVEVEAFFEDLPAIKTKFESIEHSCVAQFNTFEDELHSVIGSEEGMIACWNDVKAKIREGEDGEEDVVDDGISVEIARDIYVNYFKWVSANEKDLTVVGGTVFRPRADYASIVSRHLEQNYTIRLKEQFANSFPKDVIRAAIFETYAQQAYADLIKVNPRFKKEDFTFSQGDAAAAYKADDGDPNAAANYLNIRLSNIIKKSEPMSGPINSKPSDEDYLARVLYFNEDILQTVIKPDPDVEGGIIEEKDLTMFIPGVSTDTINTFTTQIVPVPGINQYQITAFSYTGGLDLSDFLYMQDPSSGKYDAKDGCCYYNEYFKYISAVRNTTVDNITPHLHKAWHLNGALEDISNLHTVSVNEDAAKAFVYGFLFDDVIRIDTDGHIDIGINDPVFRSMPNAIKGVVHHYPLPKSDHAVFESSSRKATDRMLFEAFQCLCDYPEYRKSLLVYGANVLEKAIKEKDGRIIQYSVKQENCADVQYATIIDVMDGFYRQARVSSLHDDVSSDKAVLGHMFQALVDATCSVCAAIFSDNRERLSRFSAYVEELYKRAKCDDTVGADEPVDALSWLPAQTDDKPFADGQEFSRDSMKNEMKEYLNNL